MVAADRRGQGLGRAAYADIFAAVARDGPPVVCEVNLAPPNDTSLAFHGNLGFRELAVESVYGGSKRVAMLGRRCDGMAEPSLPGPRDGAVLRRAARGVAVAAADAFKLWLHWRTRGSSCYCPGIAHLHLTLWLSQACAQRCC